jgi:hypothetical protein
MWPQDDPKALYYKLFSYSLIPVENFGREVHVSLKALETFLEKGYLKANKSWSIADLLVY